MPKKFLIIKIIFAATAVFLGVAFFAWTAKPFWQIRVAYKGYFDAIEHNNTDFLEQHPLAFIPYNPYQKKFRFQFLYRVLGANDAGYANTNGELFNFAVARLEEAQAKKDNFGYFDMSLGIAYNRKGDASADPAEAQVYYAKASEYFEKASVTLPNFPTVNIQHAINLERRHMRGEAIQLLREHTEKFPNFPDYHFYLGYFLSGEKESFAKEALSEMEKSLSVHANIRPTLAMDAYYSFMVTFSKQKDKQSLLTTLNRLKEIDPQQTALYDQVLDLVHRGKKIPPINFGR